MCTHGDKPSVESTCTGGLACRRLCQPGVCWSNVIKQKAKNPKSLCPARPRNDFVSGPQGGAAAQQGHGTKSTRPLGPATPKPDEGGRPCHTKTIMSAWPTFNVESPLCWESEGFLLPETTIDLHTGSFETLPLSLVV